MAKQASIESETQRPVRIGHVVAASALLGAIIPCVLYVAGVRWTADGAKEKNTEQDQVIASLGQKVDGLRDEVVKGFSRQDKAQARMEGYMEALVGRRMPERLSSSADASAVAVPGGE